MTNYELEREVRASLTPGRVVDLLAEHGPATSRELCNILGIGVGWHGSNSGALVSSIRNARRRGRPIVWRYRGPVLEYALLSQAEPQEKPIFDHGGWT